MTDFSQYKVPQSYYRRQEKLDSKGDHVQSIEVIIQPIEKIQPDDEKKLKLKITTDVTSFLNVLFAPEFLQDSKNFDNMFTKIFQKLGLQ